MVHITNANAQSPTADAVAPLRGWERATGSPVPSTHDADSASARGIGGGPHGSTEQGGSTGEVEESLDRTVGEARLRRLVESHYDFVWRSVRRLGVPEATAEDAAQQVFLVASRKIKPTPEQGERGFLFAIAMRVAADERRARRRHPDRAGGDEAGELAVDEPSPDELVDRRKARALLDQIVAELPLTLGAIFVLSEIEEMSAPQIAELMGIPLGTVASRLRRSRELFDTAVARYRARTRQGGVK